MSSGEGIGVTVEGMAHAGPERTFDAIAPVDLPRIFRGFGPLPAVVATRAQTGAWDHVGASRVVVLADGNEVDEQLTAYDRPRSFSYVVGPFEAAPLRHLVVDAQGRWDFTARDATTTAIRWTYSFRPRRLAAPLVRLVVARVWRAYARRALALAIAEAEGQPMSEC